VRGFSFLSTCLFLLALAVPLEPPFLFCAYQYAPAADKEMKSSPSEQLAQDKAQLPLAADVIVML